MRIILLALLTTSLLSLTACNEASDPDQLRPVRLTTAQQQPVVPAMTLSGEVKAKVESRLGFRLPGKIISRSVDLGERVTQGQELARLDADNQDLQAEAAKAQLKSVEAEYQQAATEYQRFKGLHQRGFISTNELERHRISLNNAKAMLTLAQSDASQASNQLSYTILRADADGVIIAINADVGEVVGAGQPVLAVAHDGPRDVLIEVPEDKLSMVHDAAATVTIWAQPDQPIEAHLREISAAANPITRTFAARYSFTDDNRSPLGRTASVHLKVDSNITAVSIPSTALIKFNQGSGVWLFNEDSSRVHQVPVELIQMTNNQLLVTGLTPGSRVVSAGVHLVEEGQQVRPFERKSK